ncbi:response regulator transcription factor [Patulibacter sp. NPDC049589]|uniref:response regulator transcription factor n=1 Tax=Patulibacter sp. NPDC049589 TaxID=3154731 RepID=UPI003412AD08
MSTVERRGPESLARRQPLRSRPAPRALRPPVVRPRVGPRHPGAATARLRVLLADETPLWRAGVARLLGDSGMDVVGEVADAGALVEAARRLRPDVVVVDVRMSSAHGDEGLRATSWIRRHLPDVAVLVLGRDGGPAPALESLGGPAGGIGHLRKDRVGTAADLVAAVECVAMGGTIAPGAPVPPVRDAAALPGEDPLSGLSAREREVLALIAEGASNAAIAARLCIAGKTVDSHVGRILVKLGLSEDPDVNRRVRAALIYLAAASRA